MGAPIEPSFDSGLLETVYELRAPLFIAFVVANVVAQYLAAVGLDVVADLLVLLAVLPLVVAVAGLLRELGARLARRRLPW